VAERSYLPRLDDIIIAIEHVQSELKDVPLPAFEADWRKRYVVERGVEIISEASRRLPDDLKARHPEIPWPKVAGIGNVLRHNYESISPSIMWALARDDLPCLERACRAELSAAQAREKDDEGRFRAFKISQSLV
jgi:uncharacterized protein with HEPN domain